MAVPGLWNIGGFNLPDFGLSERLGIGPKNSAVALGGRPNPLQTNTTVNNKAGYNGSYQTYTPAGGVLGSLERRNTTNVAGTPQSINYNGGGGGGGGGGQAPQGVSQGPSAEDLAYQAWRSAIDQANRIRSSGKATFDDLIKSVTGFRDRAKTQFGDAGQQITNTSSEILGTNARSADELRGQVQSQGRALGLGDSSRFNRQNKVAANLASTQGSTLANRGENERANRGVYDERLGQADAKEGEANSYLRNINDSAAGVEAGGVQNYGNALNSLLNYQRQLAAVNPLQAGGLQQYAPNTAGIQNSLNSVLSAQAGRSIPGGDMAANLASPTDYLSLLKQRQGLYQG